MVQSEHIFDFDIEGGGTVRNTHVVMGIESIDAL